jgi:hypothetical protein
MEEDGCLSRLGGTIASALRRLHPYGLYRVLELAAPMLGLPMPRLTIRSDGTSLNGPAISRLGDIEQREKLVGGGVIATRAALGTLNLKQH